MSTIKTKIDNDFLQAYKSKDADRSSVLRMVKSTLQNAEIAKKRPLDDAEITQILQKEVKQRKDASDQYKTGGRTDLANKEDSEIAIISTYLPAQLSEPEVEAIVKKAVAELGATSKADFGKVMGKIMPEVAGKADGALVSKIVSGLLSND